MTPYGPSTLRVSPRPSSGEIEATAWGPGAEWTVAGVPDLLGARDDVSDFAPRDPRVRAAWLRNPHWRVSRTGLVLEAITGAAIEQKVTGHEAWRGWRLLLRRFGEPAPGPGASRRMRCPPTADRLALVPSWEWLRCSIDPARSKTIVRAARVAASLERTLDAPAGEVDTRLRSILGIGVWTSAEVRQRAHGDADAVSFGDYHLAPVAGWVLTGERFTDAQLAEVLEPERPHRYRVQHILMTRMGGGPPRRGPRMPPRVHLPR